MSNFKGRGINPLNNQIEECDYLDDYFGRHRYGVKFSDGNVYPEKEIVRINRDIRNDASGKQKTDK